MPSAVAAIASRRVSSPVKVIAPGGTQTVRWDGSVYLTGSRNACLPGRVLRLRSNHMASTAPAFANQATGPPLRRQGGHRRACFEHQAGALERGCEALRRLGYEPFYFDSILERDLYFAGSVERRARELEEMFERDDIRAIICARGGYGSNYLLTRT